MLKKLIIAFLIYWSIISCQRPDYRKYISPAVDTFIKNIKPKFINDDLARIYENCFPNTLDTTVEHDESVNDTFIITGDIEAMWLRDSSFQIFPYLKFAQYDSSLKQMMLNLIRRQTKSLIIDPYANAFNKDEFASPWLDDITTKISSNGSVINAMNKKLWERKYELDSPISTLFFSYNFFLQTNETSFIDEEDWQKALDSIINLITKEKRGSDEEDKNGGPEYTFQRSAHEAFDTLHQGRGNPVDSCGLVKSMFRNSDDSTTFAYNIPENAFMVSTFVNVAKMLKQYSIQKKNDMRKSGFLLRKSNGNKKIKNYISQLTSIAQSVKDAIYENGVFADQKTGIKYFAYEVDCYGNHYFLDDPGYPSLISLPFFGFIEINDPLYISTRQRILSNRNPYYISGLNGDGLGSAHTKRRYVWPLLTIMRVLTSNNDTEILESINLLIKSAKDTGFMHESFNIDDVSKFSRPWFAWANSFFGYMINDIAERKPALILK